MVTAALVVFAANVTVAGRLAMAVLRELRLTVSPPAGAGADKFSVTLCVVPPTIVTLCGEKLTDAVTSTGWLPDIKLVAEALMAVDPMFMPLTVGCVEGVVCPAAMVTLAGETATLEESALASETVTPPAGAADDRVTARAADCPSPTVTPDCRVIDPKVTTVMVAVVSTMFGRAFAWMIAVPTTPLVTGTITLVAFAAMLTVAGTVATDVLLELRLMVNPPAGAGPESVKVRFCVEAVPTVRLLGEKPTLPTTCTG